MNKDIAVDDTAAAKARAMQQYWLKQIDDSLVREKAWRKEGRKCERMYEARDKISFNMLYSNTETLSPALYSSTPKPAVMRRYKNEKDTIGRMGAEVLNRSLTYQMDTNGQNCEDFDDLMKAVVLAGLVPGRGQLWYRYAPELEVLEPALEKLESLDRKVDGSDPVPPVEVVKDEYLVRELVPWDMYLQGFGRQWTDVPWVARGHNMTKPELQAKWPEIAPHIQVTVLEDGDETDGEPKQDKDGNKGAPMTALVWEIWDKTTKKVYFVTASYDRGVIEELDDPLGLTGFFPCPKPLSFTKQLSGLVPQTLYSYYEEQAKELEVITNRLRALIAAMRLRGFYNGLVDDLVKVLDSEENTMTPVTNAGALMDGGIDKAIWLVPLDKFVSVIQELWNQRQQIKGVIYEVTGISDIIRGSTSASETATAQDIKNRWGTMRLQDMQKIVQKYARNMLRIESEIMVKHFDQEKFRAMTDLDYPTQAEKEQAQLQLQSKQQEFAMIAQQATQAGQPPPEFPPPPPELVKVLETPSWEEVLGFLKDSMFRMYRLDIETDSTLADDIKQDQDELTQMMTAMVSLIQGLTPAVEGGFLTFDTAKDILLGVSRRFRLGSDIEVALETAQAPPPKQEDQGKLEAQKLAMEQQQMQMQQQQQVAAEAAEQRKVEAGLKQQEMAMDMERMQQDHAFKMEEMTLKHTLAMKQLEGKLIQIAAQTEANERKAEADMALAKAQPKGEENANV